VRGWSYAADYIVVVREVGFAVLAPVDLVAVQIRVICEAHGGIERAPLLAGGALLAKSYLSLPFVTRRWMGRLGYETVSGGGGVVGRLPDTTKLRVARRLVYFSTVVGR
jgi:hypothetical protein